MKAPLEDGASFEVFPNRVLKLSMARFSTFLLYSITVHSSTSGRGGKRVKNRIVFAGATIACGRDNGDIFRWRSDGNVKLEV